MRKSPSPLAGKLYKQRPGMSSVRGSEELGAEELSRFLIYDVPQELLTEL